MTQLADVAVSYFSPSANLADVPEVQDPSDAVALTALTVFSSGSISQDQGLTISTNTGSSITDGTLAF